MVRAVFNTSELPSMPLPSFGGLEKTKREIKNETLTLVSFQRRNSSVAACLSLQARGRPHAAFTDTNAGLGY